MIYWQPGLDFFAALQQRVHPAASRVDRLAGETPASFIAFDLIAALDDDLQDRAVPRPARGAGGDARGRHAAAPPHAADLRRKNRRPSGSSTSKAPAWTASSPRTRSTRTSPTPPHDVQGQAPAHRRLRRVRLPAAQDRAVTPSGSLLLGLYADGDNTPSWAESFGGLLPIGATASFAMARRSRAAHRAAPAEDRRRRPPVVGSRGTATARATAGTRPASSSSSRSPPRRVVEVRYDHMDGGFLRHPATFLRWRPDRDAASCGFSQPSSTGGASTWPRSSRPSQRGARVRNRPIRVPPTDAQLLAPRRPRPCRVRRLLRPS